MWAERSSWESVTSHGWHIAYAAIAALEIGETIVPDPIRVVSETFLLPVENGAYILLGPTGVLDVDLGKAVKDSGLCPEIRDTALLGCLEVRTSRIQLGPIGFVAVPGELLPELGWGLPSDPRWSVESADPGERGPDSAFFPQHPRECDGVGFSDCIDTQQFMDCDCTRMHAAPYRISHDDDVPPLLDLLDTEYRAVLGMAGAYLSYIIPEPDFHRSVSLLQGPIGDHYEETVSPGHLFATRVQQAQVAIDARW